MKLVFVNRFYWPDESATSQILTDLCVALSREGHDVHVVTSRKRHDDPRATLVATERAAGVTIHRVWTTRFGRMNLSGRFIDYLTFYGTAWLRLARLVRAGDVVVAKTDPPLIAVVAASICGLRQARLVNWVQDVFPEVAERLGFRAASGIPGRILRRLRDGALRRAAVNVALSDGMAAHLMRSAPAARIVVIHNWSDGSAIRPGSRQDNALRREWQLDHAFVVGYSGNLGRAHDFDTILDACERLQRRKDVAFLIIGAGPQRARVELDAARRHLRNIQFRPLQRRENLAASLGVPDVHIVSLLPELDGLIMPSKFYGAAAAGRAMIFVGRTDGDIARLVRAHRLGQVVEKGDSAALATAIEALASDPNALRDMGIRARALFEERFDMPEALARWRVLLEGLSQPAGATPGSSASTATAARGP